MNQDTINALKKAADFIKAGDTKSARAIIIEILRTEPENVQAWYMLSFSVPVKDKQIYALQQVLTLDPNHEKAKARLKKLGGEIPSRQPAFTPEEAPLQEEKPTPPPPLSSSEDLLSQRLLGETPTPASTEEIQESSTKPQTSVASSFIEAEDIPHELEEQTQPKKIFGLRRRTFILLTIAVIFIAITAIMVSFQGIFSGLLSPQTQAGGNSTNAEDITAGEVAQETATPAFTPTSVPPTPTTPPPSPTPTPFTFTTSDLQAPSENTLTEMSEIQDQLLTQLALTQNISIDNFSITDSRLQTFLWDFEKLPGMAANAEKLKTFYTVLGLAQPADDYQSFYTNIWIDPNGTLYLPDENLIALTGFEFSAYQKYSYAQAFVQTIRNTQHSFEALGIYPPCLPIDQSCEISMALTKGEAAFQAMQWANTAFEEERLLDISETNKKLYYLPVQPATNLMEQIRIFPYDYGFSFAQAVFEEGGKEALNALYESPPTTTEQILHPEKYIEGEASLPVSSTDIASLVPAGYTEFFTGPLGEWKTFLLLAYGSKTETRITPENAQIPAAGWGGDLMQIYQTEDGNTILVGHWTFDSLTDAQEFSQAMENFSTNLISGIIKEIGGNACYSSTQTTCLIAKDADVIWFLAPDAEIMEELISNYSFLEE